MKTRPIALTMSARLPFLVSTRAAPRPGVPLGRIRRTDQLRCTLDEHQPPAKFADLLSDPVAQPGSPVRKPVFYPACQGLSLAADYNRAQRQGDDHPKKE